MDQWLDWQARPLPWEHPFNLEAYFHRHFIELVEPRLRPLPENVIFPSVHELDRPAEEIQVDPVKRKGAKFHIGTSALFWRPQ